MPIAPPPTDGWRPSAPLDNLIVRAHLLKKIRDYFDGQKVLEVDTPLLSHAGTVDAHIASFTSDFCPHGATTSQAVFLHTSPEYPMKRLLAAGMQDIYYLGKVFRNGDLGRRHNPEFTLLEWYRLGFNHHHLMDNVTAFLQAVCSFQEQERIPYGVLFEHYFQQNPHRLSESELNALVNRYVDAQLRQLDAATSFDLLFSHIIEPHLAPSDDGIFQGVYVYDFPKVQAALAQCATNDQGDNVAQRFELFMQGCEIANGYHELTDATEQQQRFTQEQQYRQQLGYKTVPDDHHLIAALQWGLPPCSGVALGVDRLLMHLLKASHIQQVIAFDFERA